MLVFGLYSSTRRQSPDVVVLVSAWNLNVGPFENVAAWCSRTEMGGTREGRGEQGRGEAAAYLEGGEGLHNLHGAPGHRRSTDLTSPITGDQGKS